MRGGGKGGEEKGGKERGGQGREGRARGRGGGGKLPLPQIFKKHSEMGGGWLHPDLR